MTEDRLAVEKSIRISRKLRITVWALWPADADNNEDLYKAADQAMYAIKHNVKHSSYIFIEDLEKENMV